MEGKGANSPGILTLTTGLSKAFMRLDKYPTLLKELERHMEVSVCERECKRERESKREKERECKSERARKRERLIVCLNPVLPPPGSPP